MNAPSVEMPAYDLWANRQLFESCRSLPATSESGLPDLDAWHYSVVAGYGEPVGGAEQPRRRFAPSRLRSPSLRR